MITFDEIFIGVFRDFKPSPTTILYLVDDQGNYLMDENGHYLVAG